MKQVLMLAFFVLAMQCFSQNMDDKTIKSLADKIEVQATNLDTPVSMNAKLFLANEGATSRDVLVVKAKVHQNWHIYAYIPEGGFFIQSELKLDLPDGMTANLVNEPTVHSYEADPQIMLYKGELIFVYDLNLSELSIGEYEVSTTLSFQPCDPYTCLPPDEITVKNHLSIK